MTYIRFKKYIEENKILCSLETFYTVKFYEYKYNQVVSAVNKCRMIELNHVVDIRRNVYTRIFLEINPSNVRIRLD